MQRTWVVVLAGFGLIGTGCSGSSGSSSSTSSSTSSVSASSASSSVSSMASSSATASASSATSGSGSSMTAASAGSTGTSGSSATNSSVGNGGTGGVTHGSTASSSSGSTGSTGGITDGGSDAGVGLTCAQLLTCDQKCSTNPCTDACYSNSTATAQGLFNTFNDCLNNACPSTDGGACEDSSSSACSSCDTSAATGTCVSDLLGCEGDKVVGPPNPDGGGTIADAGSGVVFNCGQYNSCVANCPVIDGGACNYSCASQTTAEGLALAAELNQCLAMACPSTDGGPCEVPASIACNGCVAQVENAQPNTCATPYIACNNDRSNLGDAGVTPTVLVDGGVFSTVVTGIDQAASDLVIRDGYIYFTQVITGGQVMRVKLGDGGPVGVDDGGTDLGIEHVGPPQPTPVGLAVDSNNVYVWSTGSFQLGADVNNGDGTVVQIALDGGAAITLGANLEVAYDAPYLNTVAVDSQYVYWVQGAVGNDGTVMRTRIGDPHPVALYTQQLSPQAVATDGVNVYWLNGGSFDSEGRTNQDGSVMQGSVDGGAPMVLAANLGFPSSMAIDSKNVYWTSLGPLGSGLLPLPNSGAAMQVPIGGGTVTTLGANQSLPLEIAVANGTVYWTEYGLSVPGLIMSAPVGGGSIAPVMTGLDDPEALVISGNTLFWTDTPSSPTGGTIVSLSPF